MQKINNSVTNDKDNHPFDPFIPPNSKSIIIGTIPPHRFCLFGKKLNPDDFDFYYGSSDNSFWDLIQQVFPNSFGKNPESIRNFLSINRIAITDTIKSCRRKNNSASDADLYDIEFKDIGTILNNTPSIETLIYTSEMVKKHINQIFNCYHRYVDEQNKKYCKLTINNKEYECFVLYSPSPQALRRVDEAKRFEQYKAVFRIFLK